MWEGLNISSTGAVSSLVYQFLCWWEGMGEGL